MAATPASPETPNAISSGLSSAWSWIKNKASKAYDTTLGAVTGVYDKAKSMVTTPEPKAPQSFDDKMVGYVQKGVAVAATPFVIGAGFVGDGLAATGSMLRKGFNGLKDVAQGKAWGTTEAARPKNDPKTPTLGDRFMKGTAMAAAVVAVPAEGVTELAAIGGKAAYDTAAKGVKAVGNWLAPSEAHAAEPPKVEPKATPTPAPHAAPIQPVVAAPQKTPRAALRGEQSRVHFKTGSSHLSKKERAKLAAMAKQLKQEGVTEVEIDGFADKSGPSKLNQALSENRARTVRGALKKMGINATAQGHGNKEATGPRHNAEERRATISVKKNQTVGISGTGIKAPAKQPNSGFDI